MTVFRDGYIGGTSYTSPGSTETLTTYFRKTFDGSGVSNLPSTITVNGSTKTAILQLDATYANQGYWSANSGYDLRYLVSGSGSVKIGSLVPLATGKLVDASLGGMYKSTDPTHFDVTTEDILIELVWYAAASTGRYLLGKGRTGDSRGYRIVQTAPDVISCYLETPSGNITISSGSVTTNCFHYGLLAIKRNGSAQWTIDGSLSGSPTLVSSHTQTLTTTGHLNVLGYDDASGWDSALAYLAIFIGASWLDTHDQSVLAASRMELMFDLPAEIATGSSTALTATHTSASSYPKYDACSDRQTYLSVPSGWLRTGCSYRNGDDDDTVTGYLAEPAASNYFTQSVALDTWTPVSVGDVIGAGAVLTPADVVGSTLSGFSLVSAASDAQHGLSKSVTLPGVTTFTFSAHLKPGAKTDAYMSCSINANSWAYFDLVAGTVLSEGTTAYPSVKKLAGGWVRCSITYTGSASTQTHTISPSVGTDNTFLGDASTTDLYVWGPQLELGFYATTFIPTTVSTAARQADVLTYSPVLNVPDTGRVTLSFWGPAKHPQFAAGSPLSIDDGTTNNQLALYSKVEGYMESLIYKNAVLQSNLATATTVFDNDRHIIRLDYADDDFTMYMDSVEVDNSPDTSGAAPAVFTTINVGMGRSQTTYGGFLISELKIEAST